ncbi:HEPN domain-containing protein [Methylophaga sp.]|uniref:HEPN domain-containing protein n=1 Tax=Methylophaga sp. TaxID=2024840 RepID=UPI003F69904F
MNKETLLNNFAVRSFRDVADQDYIAARLSFRHELYPQFHWQSLQAIEKYVKAILLFNRIKAKDINHDLERAMKYTEKLPFLLKLSDVAKETIEHLDTYGRFRYLESSYQLYGPMLARLDKTVWEIRRYCKVLDYDLKLPSGQIRNMLSHEIQSIENSENKAKHKYRIHGGLLEKFIDDHKHPSREGLIWQNHCFGKVARNVVRQPTPMYFVNSPLTLHPEMLDSVIKYVFLPKEVINAYREHAKDK